METLAKAHMAIWHIHRLVRFLSGHLFLAVRWQTLMMRGRLDSLQFLLQLIDHRLQVRISSSSRWVTADLLWVENVVGVSMLIMKQRVALWDHEMLPSVDDELELLAKSNHDIGLEAVVVLVESAGDHDLPRFFRREFSKHFDVRISVYDGWIRFFKMLTFEVDCCLIEPNLTKEPELDLVLAMQENASNRFLCEYGLIP